MSDPYGREWVPTETEKPSFFSLLRPFAFAFKLLKRIFYLWLTYTYNIYYNLWMPSQNRLDPVFILSIIVMAVVSCIFIPVTYYIGHWTWLCIGVFHLMHLACVFIFHLDNKEGRDHWTDRLVG